MKTSLKRQSREAGQAALLVVLAMSIFLLGAAGLAVDGSHLYAQRQMAQAAADAAAEAGILSIFNGTNSVALNSHKFPTSTFTCAVSSAQTPCYYAQTMNGFNEGTDTVTVEFPTAAAAGVPPATLSTVDPVNLIRVTIQRQVGTTLLAVLGPTISTISARGTAAIVTIASPVPMLVTHPTMAGAFDLSGTGSGPKIRICGGPRRSIQVNSSNSGSMSWNGNPTVDLSHAGPLDPGDCSAGTGADFGDFGGPANATGVLTLGSTGHFIQPASPILDPLAGVTAPPAAGPVNPASPALADGVSGCPASPPKACVLYSPGQYTGTNDIDVKNQTGVFKPGIYYMNGTNLIGDANGTMLMATGFTDPATPGGTGTAWTSNVMFYFTGPGSPAATGTVSINANAGSGVLIGSPPSCATGTCPGITTYRGILFFADRNAAPRTYTFNGGGGIQLSGTIYTTNSLAVMLADPSRFQLLSFQGNPGSSTLITGQIVTNAITMGGTPGVTMRLSPFASSIVRQVALVD